MTVGEAQSPDLRIGDAEREEALKALGEHMTVGRLDADEFGERAARATAAKTRGELTQLFADLPEPHPVLAGQRAERKSVARRAEHRPAQAQRVAGALVPLSGIVAIALFFSVPGMSWVIFLLPAAVAVIAGALSSRTR
jgi:hypothetical protein